MNIKVAAFTESEKSSNISTHPLQPIFFWLCITRLRYLLILLPLFLASSLKNVTVKPVLSGHSKKTKIGFQDQLSLDAGQKYCRMLQGHSAILSTFIKLPFVIKIFVLSIFGWPPKTGLTLLITYMTSKLRGENESSDKKICSSNHRSLKFDPHFTS